MNPQDNKLKVLIKWLLFLTALTPLVVTHSTLFPFIAGKVFFFRSLVEIALILFVIYLFTNRYLCRSVFTLASLSLRRSGSVWIRVSRNPLIVFLVLFLLSLILSTIFAVDPYRAFWGTLERGEGFFGMVHFFAFLLMTVTIFDRRDWMNYLKVTLAVGAVIIFYAFLQFFDITNFPFVSRLANRDRAESFIGNPAFLAAYLILLIPIAIITFNKIGKSKLWRYLSPTIIFLSFITIFLTGTRGAILGLGTGVLFLLLYFAFRKAQIHTDNKGAQINTDNSKNPYKSVPIRINPCLVRKISIALLILLILFSGVFLATKDSSLWQKIPGLNRLAQTAIFDINDASTQTRLITWGVSWEAFKEKPIFGWGPDNYLLAYSAHYNPDYALYGETWLDRAHNKIFDVLVMQGLFGLIAYLGIFVSLFWLLFRKAQINTDKKQINTDNNLSSVSIRQNPYKSVFIAAAIIAYFIQNLFLFDDFSAYLLLFALLGFVLSGTVQGPGGSEEKSQASKRRSIPLVVKLSLSAVVILFIFYSLYFYNFVPYTQAKMITRVSLDNVEGVENKSILLRQLQHSFYPYNFAQPAIRARVIDYYSKARIHVFNDKNFADVSSFLMKALDETIDKTDDPRMLIRKAQILNEQAKVDDSLYVEAETVIRNALLLSPTRQELYYILAISLAGQSKFTEAVEVAQKAVELSERVPRAWYHLGLMYGAKGDKDEAIEALDKALLLSDNLRGFSSADLQGFVIIYLGLNEWGKIADFIIKMRDLGINISIEPVYYNQALYSSILERDKDKIARLASMAVSARGLSSDDKDIIIDLAEKEKWELLESILEIQ